MLEIEIDFFQVTGNENGKEARLALFFNFESDHLIVPLIQAVDQRAGGLHLIAYEGVLVFHVVADIDCFCLEAFGLSVEEPIAPTQDENDDDSDEESLTVDT